ncbi:MAG: EVE domain-containing protein [Candidatus Yonathbacteria bacterium RIFCSPHIGHO2_01_FULL_51_10]|uniref:EVE domain-containing protein n=1 Tax=Candidatus Yonathbacteria bacterium RIFCSPHIGHO2_01_FULL_51_10 TaxID=1802723 RepID=A0A1G2SB50_9BACT|nr:MAG: EVE domain-containing protein [Candidatus Yonathbacteria bacterium RIFCSPHIGHO2_01_FULL_51_10]
MQYWLIKSEPSSYSIDDLKRDKTTPWSGVRNFQARNFMRDDMKVGDLALFYHSSTEPLGIVGVAKVASLPYPDPTQFDKTSPYYDPRATKEKPMWFLVDFRFVKKFKRMIALAELKASPSFADMLVTQRGSRLSIQPVAQKHFEKIVTLTS